MGAGRQSCELNSEVPTLEDSRDPSRDGTPAGSPHGQDARSSTVGSGFWAGSRELGVQLSGQHPKVEAGGHRPAGRRALLGTGRLSEKNWMVTPGLTPGLWSLGETTRTDRPSLLVPVTSGLTSSPNTRGGTVGGEGENSKIWVRLAHNAELQMTDTLISNK